MIISIIAAVDKNMLIGKSGALPWEIPSELRQFRRITTGHPVIMGRKTHESIGRALPARTNVVVTSNPDYKPMGGCIVASSIEDAMEKLEARKMLSGLENDEVFIIGGRELYKTALLAADRMYITEIDHEFSGDVYFPSFDEDMWTKELRKEEMDEKTCYRLSYYVYQRKEKE